MTYNLRYASAEGPNNWPSRRPVMVELIQNIQPDILGTQEGLFTQLKDLQQDLTGYQWIGLGREGGSFGEFMAIFYCKRFDVMEYDHFWLSDTPKVIGSTTWGNTNRRMVTWILFLDKTSNRRFYVINTHFDHQIEKARINSAELLVKFLAELDPSMPVFLLGDFNAIAQDSEPYRILVEKTDMQDSWLTADSRTGEGLNTFNGFSAGPHNEGKRIDWILYRGKVRFVKLSIVDFQRQDQYPSDHFPVVGWIKWIE
ncbi:endonuclease/exonuclease/phosphatase family protein [candidate division KSB1 bacterium]|nr:endonuclease/exonuclease/phosphatase family protein [candidate division KSB1 bacterium]